MSAWLFVFVCVRVFVCLMVRTYMVNGHRVKPIH